MLRRFILMLMLLLLPLAASAATTADLGPSTDTLKASTPDTGAVLQPANPAVLQPAGSSTDSLTAPSTSTSLQPAGSKDTATEFIKTEADTSGPQSPTPNDEQPNPTAWIIGGFMALIVAYLGYYAWHTERLQRKYPHFDA